MPTPDGERLLYEEQLRSLASNDSFSGGGPEPLLLPNRHFVTGTWSGSPLPPIVVLSGVGLFERGDFVLSEFDFQAGDRVLEVLRLGGSNDRTGHHRL